MPAKTLTCVDCKGTFEFTEKDQAFYAAQKDKRTGRAWDPPKRCKPCREAAKARRAQDQQTG